MAAGGGAVGVAGLVGAGGEHGCAVGFADDDSGLGAFVGEDAGYAFEGAAGAESRDPEVEPVAFEVAENLLRGGVGVHGGVGFVVELTGTKPAVFFGQLVGFFHHAEASLGSGGEDDACAEK